MMPVEVSEHAIHIKEDHFLSFLIAAAMRLRVSPGSSGSSSASRAARSMASFHRVVVVPAFGKRVGRSFIIIADPRPAGDGSADALYVQDV
jgi:hypothetical protein